MENLQDGLLEAVRAQLEDPDAEILSLARSGFEDGFADAMTGGDGVALLSGAARTSVGTRAFRMVCKACIEHPLGANPDSWLYWKREALAYESGLLDELPQGLHAPRCFGVAHPDAKSALIYMEAVEDAHPCWTPAIFVEAARALGEFNGQCLTGRRFEAPEWMVPSRALGWLEEARPILDTLRDYKQDPIVARWLRGADFDRTRALWAHADRLAGALRDLPVCLCHHDAFRRNLMARPAGAEGGRFVAIDWAFVGPGAVGEELAAAVGINLMFMEVDMADAHDLEAGVFGGYLEGLRRAGWDGALSDVRLGFAASTALMLALGAIGPWLPLLRDPGFSPVVEKIVGVDQDLFIERLADLQGYLLDLGEEALAQIGA